MSYFKQVPEVCLNCKFKYLCTADNQCQGFSPTKRIKACESSANGITTIRFHYKKNNYFLIGLYSQSPNRGLIFYSIQLQRISKLYKIIWSDGIKKKKKNPTKKTTIWNPGLSY